MCTLTPVIPLSGRKMEDEFNKEFKQGWRLSADAARITDEKANSEDRKHTSGGVFVAIGSNLGAVVDEAEWEEGRAAQV